MKQIAGALCFVFIGMGMGIAVASSGPVPVWVTAGAAYEGQQKLLGQFVKAFLARDAEACADLYAENATYMIPETPALLGQPNILASYQELFRDLPASNQELSEPVAEVLAMGDWTVLRGTGKSTETTDSGVQTKTYK